MDNQEFTIQANPAQAESMEEVIDQMCVKYKLLLKNIFYNIDYENKWASSIDIQFCFYDLKSSYVIIEHIELDGSHSQFRFYTDPVTKIIGQFGPTFEEYIDSHGSVFNYLISELRHNPLFSVINSTEDNYTNKAGYQHMGKPEDMKEFYGVDDIVFTMLQIVRPSAQSRVDN